MSEVFILTDNPREIHYYFNRKVVTSLSNLPHASNILMFSYGKILDEEDLKNYTFFNLHNSLLPKYRGMHAFTWAIINGEKELGYTIHLVDKGIDTGPILSQCSFHIGLNEDINDVFVKADNFLREWLPIQIEIIESGRYDLTDQDDSQSTVFKKRTPEDGLVNWNSSAIEIHNFIRAQAPPYANGAYTFYENQKINICKSKILKIRYTHGLPGEVLKLETNRGVVVKTIDSAIEITSVYHNGKLKTLDSVVKRINVRFN